MIKPDFNPPSSQLRQFGYVGFVAFPIISILVLWRFLDWQMHWAVYTLWGLAAVCGLGAMIKPRALLPIYVTMMAVALPIGLVLSLVVMRVVYYLVFTPMALWFRLRGRDAMDRTLLPDADTYWTDHRDVAKPRLPNSYLRLY